MRRALRLASRNYAVPILSKRVAYREELVLRSPRLRGLVEDLVPPILFRGYLRIQSRVAKQIWARDSYDKHFDIDWHKINFNRISVINLLCAGQQRPFYLEIGCRDNDCFDAVIAKEKIGIDPERGGTHRVTSDQFFSECGDKAFDVIFIDGLHTYEQVRRDIINSLAHISTGGWIVLHDMFPRNWFEAHIPHIPEISDDWSGDVWKVSFELARSPDLDFRILKIDRGVGVLRASKKNPDIPDLRSELRGEQFRYFYENVRHLPVVDYERGRAWIESCLRSGKVVGEMSN
jgi:hypothetical protein